MKKLSILFALFLTSIMPVHAYESAVTVAVTSDYVFRGQTQTDNNSAIQATYEISQPDKTGFYAGAFASNVKRGSAGGAEIDLYAGLRLGSQGQGKFNFDLGIIEYLYTDSDFAKASHELFFGLGTDDLFAKVYWTDKNTSYLDLGARFNVTGDLNLDLHYGRTSNANDFGATLSIDFDGLLLAGSMSYHDVSKQSIAYITVAFDI